MVTVSASLSNKIQNTDREVRRLERGLAQKGLFENITLGVFLSAVEIKVKFFSGPGGCKKCNKCLLHGCFI